MTRSARSGPRTLWLRLTGNEHVQEVVAAYSERCGRAGSDLNKAIAEDLKAREAVVDRMDARLRAARAKVESQYAAACLKDVVQRSGPLLADVNRPAVVPASRGNPGRDLLVTGRFAQKSHLSRWVLGCAARAETAVRLWLVDQLGCDEAEVEDASLADQFGLHDLVFRRNGEEILLDVKNISHPQSGTAHVKDLHGRHARNIVFMGAMVSRPGGDATILGQLSRQDADEITHAFEKIQKVFYGYDSIQSAAENGRVCAWLFSLTGNILPDRLELPRRELAALANKYAGLGLLSKKPALGRDDAHLRMIVPQDLADNLDCPPDIKALQDDFRRRLHELGCQRPRLFHIFLLTIEHFLVRCDAAFKPDENFPPYLRAFCAPNGAVGLNQDPCRSYAGLVRALALLWNAGPKNLKIEKLTVFETGTVVANLHHDAGTKKFPRHTVYAHCEQCLKELVFGHVPIKPNGFLVCEPCEGTFTSSD